MVVIVVIVVIAVIVVVAVVAAVAAVVVEEKGVIDSAVHSPIVGVPAGHCW